MVELLAQCGELFGGKAEPHIGQWLLLPVHRPCHPWRVAVVHQGGEVLPGRWAKLALKGSSLRRVRRVERVCKDPVGPQGLVGERGGAGPSAHLAPSDRKARKARQGTRVGGTQWGTCPPGPQGAAGPAGPPGPAGPKGDPSPPPIFRVVTETETLAARGVSFWPALYARAAQSMERSA